MPSRLARERAASGLLLTTATLVATTNDGTARTVALIAAGVTLLTIVLREVRVHRA